MTVKSQVARTENVTSVGLSWASPLCWPIVSITSPHSVCPCSANIIGSTKCTMNGLAPDHPQFGICFPWSEYNASEWCFCLASRSVSIIMCLCFNQISLVNYRDDLNCFGTNYKRLVSCLCVFCVVFLQCLVCGPVVPGAWCTVLCVLCLMVYCSAVCCYNIPGWGELATPLRSNSFGQKSHFLTCTSF